MLRANLTQTHSLSLFAFVVSLVLTSVAYAQSNCQQRFGGTLCINERYGTDTTPIAPFTNFPANAEVEVGTFTLNNVTAPVAILKDTVTNSESYFLVGAQQGPLANVLYAQPCGHGDAPRALVGNFFTRALTPLGNTAPSHELIYCPSSAPFGVRSDDWYIQPYNTLTPVSPATFQVELLP